MAWWPGENLQASGGNVLIGPMSPQGNIVDYLGLWGNGYTTNSAVNSDTSYIGLPFEVQNWTAVQRIWGRCNTTTTSSPTLTYQFGIYNEGTWSTTTSLWTSDLMCSTASGLLPTIFNSSGSGTGASVSPLGTVLAPGVYFFTQQISNATATGATVTAGTTTVGKNRVMGVREAVFNAAPNTGTVMPASITWRAPGSTTSTWNPINNFLIVGTPI